MPLFDLGANIIGEILAMAREDSVSSTGTNSAVFFRHTSADVPC
jgi:hypothetical protein